MALTDKLIAIADAVREKAGTTEAMTLTQIAETIAAIETGGGIMLPFDGGVDRFAAGSFKVYDQTYVTVEHNLGYIPTGALFFMAASWEGRNLATQNMHCMLYQSKTTPGWYIYQAQDSSGSNRILYTSKGAGADFTTAGSAYNRQAFAATDTTISMGCLLIDNPAISNEHKFMYETYYWIVW